MEKEATLSICSCDVSFAIAKHLPPTFSITGLQHESSSIKAHCNPNRLHSSLSLQPNPFVLGFPIKTIIEKIIF